MADILYKDENNVGLPYDFRVINGKFELFGGTAKVEKNLFMWLNFIGATRVYLEDYPPDLMRLIQKPTSFIEAQKVILLGALQESAIKYLPEVEIQEMNLAKSANERKDYVLGIKYNYKLERNTTLTAIAFITV